MIAAVAIVLGLAAGLLSGGTLRDAGRIYLKCEWVLLVVFVVQGVARGRLAGTTASSLGLAVWVASSILLVVLLAANWSSPGALVAAIGVVSNLDVVLLNWGMPVATGATPRVLEVIARSAGFYRLAGPGTLAVWAGDTLPFRALGQSELFSVGDVLLSVGVAVLIAGAMTRPCAVMAERNQPPESE